MALVEVNQSSEHNVKRLASLQEKQEFLVFYIGIELSKGLC